jgi:eukaryotic-like serine/threonine-protein kinase
MMPGELLDDRFEIEQPIGSGGMATVFRARDPIAGESVAVKVISGGQSHVTERFAREIHVLAELSHPGIVRYISHGATRSGELFLVMEWVDGETVKTRLQRGPLTASEAVTLATRVAEALGAAHARGVVHRDLKPSNLFLPGGRVELVKVLDFGIARRDGGTQLTQTGMMIGTPGYMAPEQARASGPIDARADVFALGCVLFQCLTGVPPFDGDTTAAILAKILFGTAPRVSELWPEVPEPLDALVSQMLSREPALRPSDGADLAAALAALGPAMRTAGAAPHRPAASPRPAGGERRLLAVVMLSPTAQEDGLTEEPLRHAVAAHGGRLEQLADGSTVVMLDAGHEVATDQATRAARCALAMSALAGHRPLAIAMGRAESGSRLPEADVIDRASRLLAHTAQRPGDPSPIALDDASAGLLDARFDVIEYESQLRLRGERAVMHGARTLLGKPTSCIGRDWELRALGGLFEEAIEESAARVVVVTGAAGMGKSRLGSEFVGRIRERYPEVAIWFGRGDSLRAGSTLDLLAQALRGALGIYEGEPLAERHQKLRARVAERVPPADQPRVTAFLGELVGAALVVAPGDDHGVGPALRAARQDAQLMSEQMRNAWLDFLQAETAARPVLVVLDDLHWGDFGTVRFIDAALRDRGKQAWMVLALARPEVYEVFPRLWADRQNAQELRLKELGRRAGERLVRQVLGDAVGSDTVEHLVKQADGNAFYLEELIRAVAEGKDRSGPLPATVLAMVETRLGRLPPEARRVLRAASVFGEVCWESGVAMLLGTPGAAPVREWLARLVEQEVLIGRPDSRFPGERELAFRHALLREGAYATLTTDDARLVHRLAGEWLEHRGEADPMVLAGHFPRGGEGARAAGFYLRAAEQALSVLDNEAAFARTGLGLGCDPPPELRITLLGVHCYASLLVGRVALTDAEELLRSGPRGSVPWTQALFAYSLGTMMAGRIEDLLNALALLREVTPAPDAMGWMSIVFLSAVSILDRLGQISQGTALEEPFFALVRAGGDRDPVVLLGWRYAVGLRASYVHDDPWKALQHSDAIQAVYELIGGETVLLSLQLLRGMNQWYLGAFSSAMHTLEGIPAADVALGLSSADRRTVLSWLYADRGALDEARALATQLIESSHAHHDGLGQSRGHWVLAEALRRLGDLEAADREIQTALVMAMPLDQPGARATLSAIRLAQGRAGDALAAAEDAMARCAAMGGCGMFRGAFVRLAHAEALHATGAHDAARRAIADARARLLAIAARISDPGYQASFLEQVPENARTLALAASWLGD